MSADTHVHVAENSHGKSGESNKPGSCGPNKRRNVAQDNTKNLKQDCGVAHNSGIAFEGKKVEQQFKCFHCPLLFTSVVPLKEHIEISHNGLGLPPKSNNAKLT